MISRLSLAAPVRVALVAWLAAVSVAVAAAQDKVNVSGSWSFQVETDQGSGTPTIVFKQDGEGLTGTYEGQFGKAPLKGAVKGNAIRFTFSIDVQGTSADVTYDGTVEKDTMKGTMNIAAGAAAGTFTAKRQ